MIIKYGIDINPEGIDKNIDRITNQIFKLLPCREEGGDWEAPLSNLIVELGGMAELLEDHADLFSLLCKLEGLRSLRDEDEFQQFRRTIFESLGACNTIKQCLH